MPIILEGPQRLPDGSPNPEWIQARLGRITGTRFADAMAGESTKSYRDLIRCLAWERAYGESAKQNYTNAAMQHGIDTEAEAESWYSFATNADCTKPMFVIHATHSFVGVSPDLLVGDEGMSQVKCPQPLAHMDTVEAQCLPSEYKWQVHGEIWTADRKWSDFVSYHPRHGGIIVRVDRDEELIAKLEARCIKVNEAANEFAERLLMRKAA